LRTSDLLLNTIGKKIQDQWNIKLFGTYASTEMQTAFTECREGKGGHLHPELIYLELLNEKGLPAESGEAGEITITTLGVEGMPLLRYRTGDLARAYEHPCSCGRKTLRLGPIEGRKQQMIKLKGTTLYPPAIFEILQQIELVTDYVVEAYTGVLGTDELKLHIHVGDSQDQNAERLLNAAFQSRIRVVPEIIFVSQKEIDALQHSGASRKIRKFLDNRVVPPLRSGSGAQSMV
jgi:phenylacetate-CoA ligase